MVHLQAHPEKEFTATGISRAVGRSSSAIANALPKLVAQGHARQVNETPRRFQYNSSGPNIQKGATSTRQPVPAEHR
ncbi:hypothetical protein [Streptomyces iconiensis]|uniref:MarR family transcriptional regulator n=1 Tax=Streptomyces iconiensis TaxID=1384038 RepID=A0ABT7A0D1_9ACTN|nr:hypothetical protein [Streptomyces iconiensis]MDJ1134514.1 hypothetical protein [Streptomyces iconiensis]